MKVLAILALFALIFVVAQCRNETIGFDTYRYLHQERIFIASSVSPSTRRNHTFEFPRVNFSSIIRINIVSYSSCYLTAWRNEPSTHFWNHSRGLQTTKQRSNRSCFGRWIESNLCPRRNLVETRQRY